MTGTTYLSNLAACLGAVEVTSTWGDLSLDAALVRCCHALRDVNLSGGTVHLVGNGGSASVVAHAQNDFMKGAGIRALVHQDVPLLTALGNDDGYSQVYQGPLSIWLEPHDALIVVSSSGMSPNLLIAATLATAAGALVVTCSGFVPTNRLRELGQVNFYVPSDHYGYVELTHAALLHYLTDEVARA